MLASFSLIANVTSVRTEHDISHFYLSLIVYYIKKIEDREWKEGVSCIVVEN